MDMGLNSSEEQIKDIIREALKDEEVTIILYGSRSRGNARRNSDYDIALKSGKPLPSVLLSEIKFRLEESNIPFKVDIVDLEKVSIELKRNILEEGVVW